VVLNIAGPRESRCPGIYARAFGFLASVLRRNPRSFRGLIVEPGRRGPSPRVCQPTL
jgi:hypothetical protein